MFVSGHAIQSFQGEINDRVCLQLRDMINKRFGFDPGRDLTRDAVEQLCSDNATDPVCEYLDSLRWDGQPRIDDWLIRLAGAPDSPYVRAVCALILVAAVRRARQPGVKFDTVAVLESPQGTGKSTLLRILASDDFFSDQDILALDTKAQIEALDGVWIYELCELTGIRHADINKLKAFLSRSTDRARPAYGRFSEVRRRRSIFVGTTNEEEYLKDETGNRRFWPVPISRVDLEGLIAERDQLWAEAAAREAAGASILLPESLWADAQKEQQRRVESDGWEAVLEHVVGLVQGGREMIEVSRLVSDVLSIPATQIARHHYRRLRKAMTALGWAGPVAVKLPSGRTAKGYWRTAGGRQPRAEDDLP